MHSPCAHCSLVAAAGLQSVSALARGFVAALAVLGLVAGLRQRRAGRQQQRPGRPEEGAGRLRERRALCDPDRGRERQRALREERRPADRALQHAEADDGGSRLQRAEEGNDQAHRRIPRQRVCVADGRRAGRRLDDVRRAEEPDQGRGPAARPCHHERQRLLHHPGRGHRRQRARLHRDDDQARARARPDAGVVRQLERHLRSRTTR